jgi:hypothetical protein
VPLLSPTTIEGLAKVSNGFSIPPYGKLGGRITILYTPHLDKMIENRLLVSPDVGLQCIEINL